MSLSKKDVEQQNKGKLIYINSLWSSLAGTFPWNKGRVLTFQQVINEDFTNINTKGTDLNQLYEKFLSDSTNKIAKKYFPDYEEEGHIASLAIKKAIVVILYRLTDYCSEGTRHTELRFDGIFNKPLEYIFNKNLELQNWFVKHFKNELEKRIKFINK